LKERGHTRSLEQIRQSLNILAGCIIRLYVDGKKQPIYTGPILSDLVDVTRDDWLDNPKKLLMARLPLLVSAAINRLEYREFNYDRLMRLFAMFEARPKSFHNKPLCAFDGCVHFADHTPSVESA
jgi:hypothetical protein